MTAALGGGGLPVVVPRRPPRTQPGAAFDSRPPARRRRARRASSGLPFHTRTPLEKEMKKTVYSLDGSAAARTGQGRRPALEALEGRLVPSTLDLTTRGA